jgi:hypothetical protein
MSERAQIEGSIRQVIVTHEARTSTLVQNREELVTRMADRFEEIRRNEADQRFASSLDAVRLAADPTGPRTV